LVSLDHNSSTNWNNPHLYSEADGRVLVAATATVAVLVRVILLAEK
jgi:hypothetical protein